MSAKQIDLKKPKRRFWSFSLRALMITVTIIGLMLGFDRIVMKPRRELNIKYRELVGYSLWNINLPNPDSTWLEGVGRRLPANFAEPIFGRVTLLELNDGWTDKEVEYLLSVISSPYRIHVRIPDCDARVTRIANSRLREIKVIDDGDVSFAMDLAAIAGPAFERMQFVGSNLGADEAALFTKFAGKERLTIEFEACTVSDDFSEALSELTSITGLRIVSGKWGYSETKRMGHGAIELTSCLTKFPQVEHFEFCERKESNGLVPSPFAGPTQIKDLLLFTKLASFSNDGFFPHLERASFESDYTGKCDLKTSEVAKSSDLQVIEFRCQKIDPDLMAPLANLQHLNRLHFYQCTLFRNAFKPLQQVKELSWCFADPKITALDVETVTKEISDLKSLERLTLNCFCFPPSKKVDLFANIDLPNLMRLTIEDFDSKFDGIEKLTSLSTLHLRCASFDQQSIEAIAKNTSLKKLSVEVQQMSAKEVAYLERLKTIERIQLYCYNPPPNFNAIVQQLPNCQLMSTRWSTKSPNRIMAFEDQPSDDK